MFSYAMGQLIQRPRPSSSWKVYLEPLSFLMSDYCALERVIVLLNIVLFCFTLNIENADQDVNTAVLYIMFIIAYFASSKSCLTGATTLKRRAGFASSAAGQVD